VGTPNTARKGQATFLTNRLFMYSNVLLQGLRADAELAVRPSTRSGFLTRMALVDLAPKVIQKAAALGLMGAGVKAVFDLIPDYDLAKFVIIPLGIRRDDAGNAKAVYLRIPHQDTARILAAATWHLLDGHFQKGGAALVGELPHLSPPLAMASKWLTYVQGQNPLDDYRNRPIIGRDAWEAGGWNATHDMVQWTADQFGQASAVASWLTGFPDQNQSLNTAERLITQLPGISAILRTSDRGLSEKQWEAVQLDEQEAARFRLGLPDEARSLVRERYRLKRIGVDALTPAQRARLMPVEGFYRSSYVPLTRLMKDAQARGDTKRVEQLRGMLQAAARRAGASDDPSLVAGPGGPSLHPHRPRPAPARRCRDRGLDPAPHRRGHPRRGGRGALLRDQHGAGPGQGEPGGHGGPDQDGDGGPGGRGQGPQGGHGHRPGHRPDQPVGYAPGA
jgi:hypothetical protein